MEGMRTIRRVSSRGGKRADLGIYVRSSMEANIARYLIFMMKQGEIIRWYYEPKNVEFEFPVKKGSRFYKPDFVITWKSGKVEYWEVKGYMDAKSQTKLKRMAKYYPEIKIVVIDQKQYRAIGKWAKLIKNWE